MASERQIAVGASPNIKTGEDFDHGNNRRRIDAVLLAVLGVASLATVGLTALRDFGISEDFGIDVGCRGGALNTSVKHLPGRSQPCHPLARDAHALPSGFTRLAAAIDKRSVPRLALLFPAGASPRPWRRTLARRAYPLPPAFRAAQVPALLRGRHRAVYKDAQTEQGVRSAAYHAPQWPSRCWAGSSG